MKADIFFFVTTIAVVLISILIIVGLIYVVIILAKSKKIIEMVKDESQEVIQDIREFRIKLKTEDGFMKKVPAFITFIRNIGAINKRKKYDKQKRQSEI